MSAHLLEVLAEEIAKLLDPIAGAVDNPYAFDRLLAELGAKPETVGDDRERLRTALTSVAELQAQTEALMAHPSLSLQTLASLLDLSDQALTAVRALRGFGDAADAFEDFGEDLAAYLIASYLDRWHPLAHSLATLATLIEPAHEQEARLPVVHEDVVVREAINFDRFRFHRLIDLIRDPRATLRSEYGSVSGTLADAQKIQLKLFPRLQRVLRVLGVPCRYGFDPDSRDSLGDAAPYVEHALIIYVDDELAGAPTEAGVVLNISPADRGDLGLVISPFGTLTTTRNAGPWSIEISLTGDVDVLAYGRHGVTLVASPATSGVQSKISATLPVPEDEPAFVLGAPTGSRLEVGGAQITAETSLSEARQSLALSAAVSSSAIVIAPGDGDSFLSSILPSDGVQAKFDLGLEWSNERGLTFRGAAGLDATFHVGLSIRGVLTVPTVHLSLQAREGEVVAEVSASVGASIGPVHVAVERVGLAATVTFPKESGNLGVADVDFGFKPPTGVGLVVNAPGVVGGGFLRFDPQKGEYSGILELEIAEKISVKGFGLLNTRMPGGGKGYSLIVVIFVENFTPVPLGFGFNLIGIGGLLAINRTFDEATLRGGLKNHTLDSVMFPQDPIRNVPQILSNLSRVFPAASGHHLFGPMVQISWGTPPLITAEVAVVLEFGARRRLLLLAQVLSVLPRPENDLVRLQMDAIGVLDLDQGTAALDATLHDSRLLQKFPLTGEMAMRMNWRSSPNFALAVGGLHPAFNPPPNFPKLERISINLSSGDNPRFRCEAYFALTSNTVQFGARAELLAKAAGFTVHGDIGFDVLIQFDPFFFLAKFHAQLQLKRGSTNLFKVRLEGSLAGPRPLHIKGKATFEIFWWDVTVRIDKTLVGGEKPPLPAPIDVLPRLRAALNNPGNWVSRLPDRQRPLVELRADASVGADILLHPLGTLTVKQGVVPLNVDISRFGQGPPAGARHFTISGVSLGENDRMPAPVKDFFAPAEFFEMSDDDKLSRPSFEKMDAGVTFGSDDLTFSDKQADWLEVKTIEFETWLVDDETRVAHRSPAEEPAQPQDPQLFYQLSRAHLVAQASFGAAGSSDLRRSGDAKYRTTTIGKYQVTKEGWSIVATEDLTEQLTPGLEARQRASYSEAAQSLLKLKQENPEKAARLKILRLSEVRV